MRHNGLPMRVVVVDDDQDYLEALKGELEDRGFAVWTFADGQTILRSFEVASQAHVVVLDWAMPKMPGIELLRRLREDGIKVPIVFLTGRSLVEYEWAALKEGALDFIDKARGVDVLVRRLVLIAGRDRAKPPIVPPLRLGSLMLRLDTTRAEWRGRDVGLTVNEYKVVALLAAKPGQFSTYREIYDVIHYVGFLAGHGQRGINANVRSTIKRIRNKFLSIDPGFDDIVNQSNVGYAWREAGATKSPSPTDLPAQSNVPNPL